MIGKLIQIITDNEVLLRDHGYVGVVERGQVHLTIGRYPGRWVRVSADGGGDCTCIPRDAYRLLNEP